MLGVDARSQGVLGAITARVAHRPIAHRTNAQVGRPIAQNSELTARAVRFAAGPQWVPIALRPGCGLDQRQARANLVHATSSELRRVHARRALIAREHGCLSVLQVQGVNARPFSTTRSAPLRL